MPEEVHWSSMLRRNSSAVQMPRKDFWRVARQWIRRMLKALMQFSSPVGMVYVRTCLTVPQSRSLWRGCMTRLPCGLGLPWPCCFRQPQACEWRTSGQGQEGVISACKRRHAWPSLQRFDVWEHWDRSCQAAAQSVALQHNLERHTPSCVPLGAAHNMDSGSGFSMHVACDLLLNSDEHY